MAKTVKRAQVSAGSQTGERVIKELEVQTRVVEAVRLANGAGDKISHKYIKGVADLLLKLPNYQPLLAEVKVHQRPVFEHTTIALEMTELQRKFLYRYEKAGMHGCIMSFLYAPVKNYQSRDMWIGVFPPSVQKTRLDDYKIIPRGGFNSVVVYELEKYLMGAAK